MNDEQTLDVVVIGGGPGGYVAAIRASQLGLRVGLVEQKALGGTCLNIGCIPSKALLASSEHYRFLTESAEAHGIRHQGLHCDVRAMMRRKYEIVGGLVRGISGLMRKNQISVFEGHGRIPKPGHVEVVADGTVIHSLTAREIVVATGSVPAALPNLPVDGSHIVTSTEALAFDSVPARLLVIGAGAIGLELGSVWARLGSKVSVIEFLPRIAPGFDTDIASGLKKSLEGLGVEFHLDTKVTSAQVGGDAICVTAEHGANPIEFHADKVLVAVGRKPHHEGVFDESIGVRTDDRGRLIVDSEFQTSVRGIRAIGDVVPGPMLAHKAGEDGVAVAEILAGGHGHVNYSRVPNVIYTHPEAASVGMDAAQATESGLEVRTGMACLMANGRALANGDREGFVKVVADAKTDRLLGVHILAANASEMIGEAVTALEFRASCEDLARTVHAHPTVSECIKEACLSASGRALHG